jgi:sulfate adenylyltransferase large subunit
MATHTEPAEQSAIERSSIERFLAHEQGKTLLRFTTAGSVDDGKSTLIGRLLYDSHNVYEDQVRSIAKFSANRGHDQIDLSLLTDGLRAEREQGITIDVAYRYFSTARRKFIIADTPGHEQYTRNMATGASTADLAIILLDARKGVLQQSRRHAYISSLLGIPHIVAAVNKMDLVDYSEEVFERIKNDFLDVLEKLGCKSSMFLPLSALTGDNVVSQTVAMPWFAGPSLLEYLENVEIEAESVTAPFRLPVQYVIRPNQEFRGFAGQIASGTIRPGQEVTALPSGRRTRVKRIAGFEGDLESAYAPMSVTLTLEDEIDISQGDLLAGHEEIPSAGRSFEADVVWMSETPIDTSRALLLKHTSQTVRAEIREIEYRINLKTLDPEAVDTLSFNDIGRLRIETSKPLFFDPYRLNRMTGSFILIDPIANSTLAAGMILHAVEHESSREADRLERRDLIEPVTAAERMARYRHFGAIVKFGDRLAIGYALERRLFEEGCAVILLPEAAGSEIGESLQRQGFIVLQPGDPGVELPPDDVDAADRLHARLTHDGVFVGISSLRKEDRTR